MLTIFYIFTAKRRFEPDVNKHELLNERCLHS